MRNLSSKLINIQRTIAKYADEQDEMIEEYQISLPVDVLNTIVTPAEDDPMLYEPYDLTTEQLTAINKLLEYPVAYESGYIYVLECEGIYDWDK